MQEFKEEPNFEGAGPDGGGAGGSQRSQPEGPSSDNEYSPGHKYPDKVKRKRSKNYDPQDIELCYALMDEYDPTALLASAKWAADARQLKEQILNTIYTNFVQRATVKTITLAQLRKLLSRLRIEKQKKSGDYGGVEEEGDDYDDNDDSNMGDGDGNDDDFNWPAADVSATVADDQSPSKVRTYRSKNFGKNDIEIATALMREIDPNNTLASAKWGQGFREEKDKILTEIYTRFCKQSPCLATKDQLRKLLSRIRNQEWKLENPGEGKYYGSNVWYGGKLGEEEEDPDWDPYGPYESGSRKRTRSQINDWSETEPAHPPQIRIGGVPVRYQLTPIGERSSATNGSSGIQPGSSSTRVFAPTPNFSMPLRPVSPTQIRSMLDEKERSVIVIGAGVSGISAAFHLKQHGIENVAILEGSQRWGGRVHTEKFGSSVVEIGANWIHGGCVANPVFNIANRRRKSLLLHDGKVHRMTRRKGLFYTPEGHCIDQELGERAFDTFFEIERNLTRFGDHVPLWEKMSIQQYLEAEFQNALDAKFTKEEHPQVEAIFWGMINYMKFHAGDDTELCRANLYGRYWDIPGGDVKIPGGYQNVFAEEFDAIKERVLFSKEVVKVDINGPKVRVECRDGSGFQADHVICTVPLGYLKANHKSLFDPPLPPAKVEAIERIGFGRAGKVFIEFDAPFWSEGEEVIKIAWGKQAIKVNDHWTKSVMGFDEVLGNPNVLVAWVGGAAVAAMESISGDQLMEDVTALLRRCTGDPSLRAPVKVVRTKWVTDPLYLGSYSYGGLDSEFPQNQYNLMEPVSRDGIPKVLFAGEATEVKSFSTVHGARLSGLREANRIAALYPK